MNWLGNQISRFTEFSLLEKLFGSLVPFLSVLSHPELDLCSVCFFGFLTFLGMLLKIFIIFLNRIDLLGN